jgi:uncharacterized protein
MVQLNAVECRVVGCLIEKEITTPEYYPLSLNALVNACNQKSSREPVMSLSEADVRSALFELENMGAVRVLADARVSKFEHRVYDQLKLRRDEIAVMCLLLLRGPQTAAELRGRADRLYAFDDTQAVGTTLERLAGRDEPLVRQLPRQPGSRESRWAHLLSGEPAEAAASVAGPVAPSIGGDRMAALEALVEDLRQRVEALEASLRG